MLSDYDKTVANARTSKRVSTPMGDLGMLTVRAEPDVGSTTV